MKLPWARDKNRNEPAFEPLGNDAGFLLSIEGHKVVALRLAGKIAREVAGQAPPASGIVAKLAKIFRPTEIGQWLIVADLRNGVTNDYGQFASLIAQRLTEASGITVPVSSLVVAGGRAVAGTERLEAAPKVSAAAAR